MGASGVLTSKASSTYQKDRPLVFPSAAAVPNGLFEHPYVEGYSLHVPYVWAIEVLLCRIRIFFAWHSRSSRGCA